MKQKIYQMFILGLEGENLKNNPNLIDALHNNLGGVIFFTKNIKTKEQIKELIKNIKKETKITPFLSIDQEGGRVERTENLFEGKCVGKYKGKKYLSPKYAAEKGENFLKEQTEKIAVELKDFGFNLNFAPCLDVNTNPANPIIGERAFSDNTEDVIKYGKIVVETYLKNNIIPCTKHFPGHGDASIDSHISLPQIDLSLDEIEKIHIKPFLDVESPMIMIAHLYCTAFDKNEIPSSLSKNVINYLRETMQYKGLIITDDMIMGGVDKSNIEEKTLSAIKAIKAGVNILLYRNSLDETIKIIENLANEAITDKELCENIMKSYERIIEFKQKRFIC